MEQKIRELRHKDSMWLEGALRIYATQTTQAMIDLKKLDDEVLVEYRDTIEDCKEVKDYVLALNIDMMKRMASKCATAELSAQCDVQDELSKIRVEVQEKTVQFMIDLYTTRERELTSTREAIVLGLKRIDEKLQQKTAEADEKFLADLGSKSESTIFYSLTLMRDKQRAAVFAAQYCSKEEIIKGLLEQRQGKTALVEEETLGLFD